MRLSYVTCKFQRIKRVSTSTIRIFENQFLKVRDDEPNRHSFDTTPPKKSSIPSRWLPVLPSVFCPQMALPAVQPTLYQRYDPFESIHGEWVTLSWRGIWEYRRSRADWNWIGLHCTNPTWYRSDRPHWCRKEQASTICREREGWSPNLCWVLGYWLVHTLFEIWRAYKICGGLEDGVLTDMAAMRCSREFIGSNG